MSLPTWADWDCPRCSLINTPDCDACEACDLARPDAVAADPRAAFFNMALASAGSKRPIADVVDLASSDDDDDEKEEIVGQKPCWEMKHPAKRRKTDPDATPTGASTESAARTAEPEGPVTLRVASLNVWFDEVLVSDRVRCMTHTIATLQPHVVFLQEVTPDMCRLFKARMVHFGYVSPSDVVDVAYGEMIFLQRSLPVHHYERVDFPRSTMGRGLHTLETTVGGQRFVAATAHLESLGPNRAVRLEQLDWSFQVLATSDHPWVFGGDMNLGNRDKAPLPEGVDDAWVACGCDPLHEHTWDTSVNKNLPGVAYVAKCRFDRIFSHGLAPTTFTTFGKDTLPTDAAMYPSDHWGVAASYSFS
ncbi:hypothetical protein SPRG_01070 [Saprolegnia parasitica CBS 223.65]|uniref:RanBP2-type domain-containing protein n=1 Tax=Saprolegnia parasitica (strain CBS 223.65) TaxID=695850 RepID=A0A067D7M0_SAPPC|nr:hypothetical protein SPRG_01070 [Saprolegnia parasitica CBS 223.65]KDO35007.1 hypothetical protein SPRG_01070 [Saprolegnia parasitica CBS 223.65]|eukprot:XP_012194660.1 hypothetical protein SPRG_01070 [Saprolegnia parasitica CBS 223.65]